MDCPIPKTCMMANYCRHKDVVEKCALFRDEYQEEYRKALEKGGIVISVGSKEYISQARTE